MIKVKDGYAKLIGTTYSGSADRVLLSNGGDKAVSDFAAASALSNYVTLTTAQTITGLKTFANIIHINSGQSITDEGGNGVLGVKSTTWTGVPSDGTAISLGTLQNSLYFRSSGDNMYHYRTDRGAAYKVLDASNYSYYALPLSGGELTGPLSIKCVADRKLILDNTDGEKWSLISFREKGEEYGYLGVTGSSDLNWNGAAVIHSANYTTYTVKKDGTGATGTWPINITGNSAASDKLTAIKVFDFAATAATYCKVASINITGRYGGGSGLLKFYTNRTTSSETYFADSFEVFVHVYQQNPIGEKPVLQFKSTNTGDAYDIIGILNYSSSGSTFDIYAYGKGRSYHGLYVSRVYGDITVAPGSYVSSLPVGTQVTPLPMGNAKLLNGFADSAFWKKTELTKLSQLTDDIVSGNYLPLAGGNMKNAAVITFTANGTLRQTTATTSNATSIIEWYKGTTKDPNYTHSAQIGWHNTGNTDGAIYLVPHPQNTNPWDGSVGLYIGKTALKWNNQNIIHSGNIGTQSVAYATNADTVDNLHASAFAKIGTYNNLTHAGNEFTFASSAFSGDMWINYRTSSGSADGNITGYYFGDGKGGSLAKITSGNFSGNSNSASKLRITSCYNGTTNNDLWSTVKSSNSSYLGTATIYEVYNDGGPVTYGHVLDIVTVHSNHWQPQLWFDAGKGGRLRYRNKEYNDNSWGDWRAVAFTSDIPTSLPANGGNADTVDSYHASSLWRSDGAKWNPNANVTMTPTGNGQEWSFDFRNKGSYTGSYWHVWDESKSTLLKVDADSGAVSAPYGFVGNLTGKASALTNLSTGDVASATATKRKVWFSYDDGVTGRPALSDNLTFQVNTNTLYVPHLNGKITIGGGSYNWYEVQQFNSSNGNPSYYSAYCAIININSYTGWQPWIRGVDSENGSWTIGQYTTCLHIGYIPKTNTNNTLVYRWDFNKDGSTTLPGGVTASGNIYAARFVATAGNSYQSNGGIILNNSDIWGLNAIYTADLADAATEGYQFKRSNGNYDSIWCKDGNFYFSPNGHPDSGYSTNYFVLHSGNFDGFYYTLIDASSLDNNTWYPVTMSIGNSYQTNIRIQGHSSANASWNGRSDKNMAVILDYTVNGSTWGWTSVQRVVHQFQLGAGAGGSNCIAGLGQLTNNSTEYVYVRGGAKYHFYISRNITPVLRTSTYTGSGSQTVSPTTSSPTAIVAGYHDMSLYAPHFYENSDANLKKNIKAILDSDNIPVIKEFDWKSDGTHSYGLIAQELEEQGYSELVNDSGSHKTVNYSAALSLIVGKLQNKIKELEKEIENLKLRN